MTEDIEIKIPQVEKCRKCEGYVLVTYFFDEHGVDNGWRVKPLQKCGRPDRCGEKVIGLTFPGEL
ncbi:MAG: hypothetical protein GVY13_14705 [Alphaproteobacteria bacterium]|jgi:hypothetical protein|nr:hypothetical protein [Alphaproteobacteria bacterium]